MAIAVACRCGQRFAAPPHLAGNRVPCPTCQSPIDIPFSEIAAPAAPQNPTLIPVVCRCGGQFGAPPHLAGQIVACPACQNPIAISGNGGGYAAQPTYSQPAWQAPDPLAFYSPAAHDAVPQFPSPVFQAPSAPEKSAWSREPSKPGSDDFFTRQYMPQAQAEYKKKKSASTDDVGSGGGLWGSTRLTSGICAFTVGVVWLFVGLAFGWLFYYPLFLIVSGLYGIVTGMFSDD